MERHADIAKPEMDWTTYRRLEKKALQRLVTKANGEVRNFSATPNVPYETHPVAIRDMLITLNVTDKEEWLAALLHDIIEDSDVTTEQLAMDFSPRVAAIVGLVSKPEPFDSEAFYGAIMTADEAIGLPAMRIKVCDRMNNLLTNMAYNTSANAAAYAAEARQYFLPMAGRVGLVEPLELSISYIEQCIAAGQ
ncbi:MAG TPA: HD domain-containing protein [Candidatus Saccharimonadales bacterium]|nr:HD domain-containing protein [Candidatus Saccharimonadales bacterium]